MTVFNNQQDVLDFYGAKDESHMSKQMYKFTKCGAWAKFDTEFVKTGTSKKAYTALLQKSISGVYVHHIVEGYEYVEPKPNEPYWFFNVPDDLKTFINLDPTKTNWSLISKEDFDNLKSYGTVTVKKLDSIRKILTFVIERDVGTTQEGLRIGSIVEGSDSECDNHFLSFPFTSQDLNDAIEQIEDQANELWIYSNNENT